VNANPLARSRSLEHGVVLFKLHSLLCVFSAYSPSCVDVFLRRTAEARSTLRVAEKPGFHLSRPGTIWHFLLGHREHWWDTVRITDVEQHSLGHLTHHLFRFKIYHE